MNDIISNIRKRAAALGKHLVFPEGEDPRVLEAAHFLKKENICEITLLHGNQMELAKEVKHINYRNNPPHIDAYAQSLWEKRRHKLSGKAGAQSLLQNPLYYGAAMVDGGHADGCVAGAVAATPEVIRAGIQTIGVKQGTSIVSSIFLMVMPNGQVCTYADCGVVPYPDKNQLADIALNSAHTHRKLTGEEPKVAMLSFSTKGSAPHPRSQLVKEATETIKAQNPDLIIDGELQFDAAFVPEVARRKAPESVLKGQANVFIFPNIDAGNIAYKITERLAGAGATGPIIQGLAKPMMDLSRGCDWKDIVNAACAAILIGQD